MLLIINSLEMPEVAPLPSMMELETPVTLAVLGPIYMLFVAAASLVYWPQHCYHCHNVPLPLAKVVKAGILKWLMLLIINSLEMPKVAPLPSMMELETPVMLAVLGPIYMLFVAAASLVELAAL